MRYWWVNQNQTFRQELGGGYVWSPKRNANGARNPFYESMREISPGDIIFSFVDTRIAAIGIADSYCWEIPKPLEFGLTGQYWENVGWKVNVRFTPLPNKVRPKDHMGVLRAVLPERYSPLQSNGNGIQSVYLTQLPQHFAEVLAGLIGEEARSLILARELECPRCSSRSSQRRIDREYQRYQRTAQRMSACPVCRQLEVRRSPNHLTFFSRCPPGPSEVSTRPPSSKEAAAHTTTLPVASRSKHQKPARPGRDARYKRCT